jgi:hypothetical protein
MHAPGPQRAILIDPSFAHQWCEYRSSSKHRRSGFGRPKPRTPKITYIAWTWEPNTNIERT